MMITSLTSEAVRRNNSRSEAQPFRCNISRDQSFVGEFQNPKKCSCMFVSHCQILDILHSLNFHASCGDLLGKVMFLVSLFELLLTCVESSLLAARRETSPSLASLHKKHGNSVSG